MARLFIESEAQRAMKILHKAGLKHFITKSLYHCITKKTGLSPRFLFLFREISITRTIFVWLVFARFRFLRFLRRFINRFAQFH